MKTKILLLSAILLSNGCAIQRVSSIWVNPDTKVPVTETYSCVVWFQQANVEGLKVHQHTKTGSTGLIVSKEATETQVDVIAGLVQAAVTGAVKGIK